MIGTGTGFCRIRSRFFIAGRLWPAGSRPLRQARVSDRRPLRVKQYECLVKEWLMGVEKPWQFLTFDKRKMTMSRIKYRGLLYLMGVSMILLVALQVVWLRTEYRSASEAFSRETNLLFRSSVRQLADSLFFSRFWVMGTEGAIARTDSLLQERTGLAGTRSMAIMIRSDSLPAGDTNLLIGSTPPGGGVSSRVHAPGSRSGFFDWQFRVDLPPDSVIMALLQRHFSESLWERHAGLTFKIEKGPSDWHRMWQPLQNTDSIQHAEPSPELPRLPARFSTSFVPLAPGLVYAAVFEGVNTRLYKGLLPQLGFSVFITGLILLSFLLIYRNLLAQQRLVAQKNDFIGNVTHELKTPVATVGVALEALQHFDVLKDPQKTREYLQMATQELHRLSMMTDKILKTSVLDLSTEIGSYGRPVDMADLAEKVLSSFSILAAHKSCHLALEKEGNTLVTGNEDHLEQVVYNLVDNAIKHGGSPNRVLVRVCGTPERVKLEVSDEGPGIPEVYRNRVFERFFRVPSGMVHNVKGHGLGLHYVAGVVKGHGGSIHLEGRQGGGARFVVKLPARNS